MRFTNDRLNRRSFLFRVCYPMGMRIKVENHIFGGGLWLGAWLFTIGFLHLAFWQGVAAIVIWPYYLGVAFAG